LFETRKMFGAPCQISYSASFHSLNKEISSGAIVGTGSKIKWIVAPTHEQLPIEKCFPLAKLSGVFGACAFRPQELLNANRGDGYTLILEDFAFHDGDCFTPKGSGFGSPNPDGSRERWTWKGVAFSREDVLRVWGIGPVFPRGSRQERVLGNRRAAFRPIGLRTCPPDNMWLFPTQ
jgi:hypothetical protein